MQYPIFQNIFWYLLLDANIFEVEIVVLGSKEGKSFNFYIIKNVNFFTVFHALLAESPFNIYIIKNFRQVGLHLVHRLQFGQPQLKTLITLQDLHVEIILHWISLIKTKIQEHFHTSYLDSLGLDIHKLNSRNQTYQGHMTINIHHHLANCSPRFTTIQT